MESGLARALDAARNNRCGVVVAALVLFVLVYPAFMDSRPGRVVANATLSVVLIVALWALRFSPRVLAAGVLLGVLSNLPLMNRIFPGQPWAQAFALGVSILFIGFVTLTLLRYVMNMQRVTADKICGAVAVYILIAFLFATVFVLLMIWEPNAFAVNAANALDGLGRIDMIYFSFTVLTSTGFGEITPATRFARSLIILEQVTGVMYVAFLIARLTNLYPAPGDREA